MWTYEYYTKQYIHRLLTDDPLPSISQIVVRMLARVGEPVVYEDILTFTYLSMGVYRSEVRSQLPAILSSLVDQHIIDTVGPSAYVIRSDEK